VETTWAVEGEEGWLWNRQDFSKPGGCSVAPRSGVRVRSAMHYITPMQKALNDQERKYRTSTANQ